MSKSLTVELKEPISVFFVLPEVRLVIFTTPYPTDHTQTTQGRHGRPVHRHTTDFAFSRRSVLPSLAHGPPLPFVCHSSTTTSLLAIVRNSIKLICKKMLEQRKRHVRTLLLKVLRPT